MTSSELDGHELSDAEGVGVSQGRGRIITAAAQLFDRRSYDKTSVGDISGLVGIAKATVYDYIRIERF